MLELGRMQTLEIVKEKDFGVYLGNLERAPGELKRAFCCRKSRCPRAQRPAISWKCFLYKDSEDRIIATTTRPKLSLGETAVLEVKETSKIGAFLDMGLEKDLLLPFKEQTHAVKKGRKMSGGPLCG